MTFFPGDADAGMFEWHHGGIPTQAWVAAALAAAGFTSHEFIYTPSFKGLKKLWAFVTNMPQYGRLIARAYVD
jgi:hypothetical protein